MIEWRAKLQVANHHERAGGRAGGRAGKGIGTRAVGGDANELHNVGVGANGGDDVGFNAHCVEHVPERREKWV